MISSIFSRLRHSLTLRAFGLVTVLAGLAKLAGLTKELIVAAEFGISNQIDAYLFVFNMVSAPTSIWFGAIFSTLVPFLIRLDASDPASANKLRSQFLTISLIAGLAIGTAWGIGLNEFVQRGGSGLAAETRQYARNILPLMTAIVPIFFVAHFAASCLMAKNRHTNTLYEGLPALVIVLALLTFPATIGTIALATVAGCAVQMAATLLSASTSGSLHWPQLPDFSAWKPFWPGFAVMLGVQALQSATPLVDQIFAAQLKPGSLATFNYAFRIFALFLTMAALALPRVLLPALASIAHDQSLTRRFVVRWSLALGGTGTFLAIATCVYADTIVDLMFERGAFTATDTTAVAQVLSILIWQLPFYLLSLLYAQQHFTAGRYGVVATISAGMLAIKLGLGLWLVWEFGLIGLAASGIPVFAFQALALFVAARLARKSDGVEGTAS